MIFIFVLHISLSIFSLSTSNDIFLCRSLTPLDRSVSESVLQLPLLMVLLSLSSFQMSMPLPFYYGVVWFCVVEITTLPHFPQCFKFCSSFFSTFFYCLSFASFTSFDFNCCRWYLLMSLLLECLPSLVSHFLTLIFSHFHRLSPSSRWQQNRIQTTTEAEEKRKMLAKKKTK